MHSSTEEQHCGFSQKVTHPSTNAANCCLTSIVVTLAFYNIVGYKQIFKTYEPLNFVINVSKWIVDQVKIYTSYNHTYYKMVTKWVSCEANIGFYSVGAVAL